MARIVMVDDDVELASTLAGVLESEGYEIETIDNVAEGYDRVIESKPDLAILDIMFPENPAGGFDLARRIRSEKSMAYLPIILLTAVNQELPMDFSAKDIDDDWMPVQDFVEKPPNIPELLGKVKKLLGL